MSARADMRLRLELVSVPESVALVRSLIRTVAQTAALEPTLVDDVRTAISEACNNVVLHAYPDLPGSMVISLNLSGDMLELVVRDQGTGIRPVPGRNRGLGMGVALINSLAERAEFQSSELGTEVKMRFRCPVSTPGQTHSVSLEGWTLADQRSTGALRARSD